MFTITFLTRRRPEVSLEQFVEHYKTVHFDLARELPSLVSYRQALLAHDSDGAWRLPGSLSEYDALSVYGFASRADADAAFDSPAGVALNDDTGLFIDWASVLSLPSETLQTFGQETP